MLKLVLCHFVFLYCFSVANGQTSNIYNNIGESNQFNLNNKGEGNLSLNNYSYKTSYSKWVNFSSEEKQPKKWHKVIGFVGFFMIGYPIGQAITNKNPQWGIAGVGVGLATVSFFLSNPKKSK